MKTNQQQHSPECKGTLHYYDGCLGYEAMRCDVCGYELDLNAEANAKATAEREAAEQRDTAQPLSEAYDIKNVYFRNLLTVAVGTISNQTGESFDSATLRGKCADEILRRFNETKSQLDAYSIELAKTHTHAERLAEALKLMRRELATCARDCMTEAKAMRWTDDNAADISAREALAAWEGAQK
jgi:hypothetical protein